MPSSKPLKRTATKNLTNRATSTAQQQHFEQSSSLFVENASQEPSSSASSPTDSIETGFLSAKFVVHEEPQQKQQQQQPQKTANRVSKEALRRLARSWHLKSSAVALDRLTDPTIAVATHDPEFCLALWKAAAYLAVESGSKTITAKFVDHAILVNNIIAEACETQAPAAFDAVKDKAVVPEGDEINNIVP